MKKRILPLFLAASMAFTAMPVYAIETPQEQIEHNNAEELQAEQDADTIDIAEDSDQGENPQIEEPASIEVIEPEVTNDEAYATDNTIQVGTDKVLTNVNAFDSFDFYFTAPETNDYHLSFNGLEDKVAYTLYDSNNKVIQQQEGDYYSLEQGETYRLFVFMYYGADTLTISLTQDLKVTQITADLPDYIYNLGINLDFTIDLHLQYSDGTTNTLLGIPYGEALLDEVSGKEFFCGIDYGESYDGNKEYLDVICMVDGEIIPLGSVRAINADDPSVKRVNGVGTYQIPVSELTAGKYLVYPCEDGYYSVTVSGDQNNSFTLSMSGMKGDYYGSQTAAGVVVEGSMVATENVLLTLDQLGDNTELTVKIKRLTSVESFEIQTEDYYVQGEPVDFSFVANYDDGSEETFEIEMDPSVDSYGYVISKFGYKISYAFTYDVNRPAAPASLYVVMGLVSEEAIFPILPTNDFEDAVSSECTLTEERILITPELGGGEYAFSRIESEISGSFEIFGMPEELDYWLYAEQDGSLVSAAVDSLTKERVIVEAGKTYYLFCQNMEDYPVDEMLVSLTSYLVGISTVNTPAQIYAGSDLEEAKLVCTYSDGKAEEYPLWNESGFNTSGIPVYYEYYLRYFDEESGFWLSDWNMTRNDLQEYLLTGESEWIAENTRYQLGFYYGNVSYNYEFLLKADDTCVITEQPQQVTSGIKAPVAFHVEAENAASYQWQYSKDGEKWYSSSASTAKSDTLAITVSKTNYKNVYRCKVTGKDGQVLYSETVGIELIPWVTFTVQPDSPAISTGETVSFHVEADNAVAYQWQYSKNGTTWVNSTATGSTTDTLTIKVSNNNKSNLYRCAVTGIDGNKECSKAAAFIVLTEQPKDSFSAVGTKATFSLKAENASGYQWQYSKDGGATWYKSGVTGNTTDTITFNASSSNRGNLYRCKIETEIGAFAYTKAVGFKDGIVIVSQPADVTIATGKSARFMVVAEGEGLSYQWQYSKDGGKSWISSTASSAKTATLSTTAQTAYNGRLYRCVIKDGNGNSVVTDYAVLIVA